MPHFLVALTCGSRCSKGICFYLLPCLIVICCVQLVVYTSVHSGQWVVRYVASKSTEQWTSWRFIVYLHVLASHLQLFPKPSQQNCLAEQSISATVPTGNPYNGQCMLLCHYVATPCIGQYLLTLFNEHW